MKRTMKLALAVLCLSPALAIPAAAQNLPGVKTTKIRDGVFMATAAGNVYLVTTPEGNVVIDTASAGWAPGVREALAPEVHGPVKYILLTHSHADHIGGIPLWRETGTQIVAQKGYTEFINYVARLEGFYAPRNAAAFGGPVKEVGLWRGNFAGKQEATVLFDEKYEFTCGGLRFEMYSTPGETPDHATIWIPSYKIAFIGDNYDGAGIPEPMSVPNIYTLRGTKPRSALDWIKSIDTVIALKPDVVLMGHGAPIEGNAEITRRLTRFRDAIQWIHDETVKGMNAGKDVYTLMQEIKLPASFGLSEVFGKVTWDVRGIYDGYVGWFDTNPATLYDVPASAVYPDLVKLAGGPDAIVKLAAEKFAAGKPVETLHLTDVVLAADPKNGAAIEVRLKALNSLHDKTDNFIEAGWLEYGIRKTKERLEK